MRTSCYKPRLLRLNSLRTQNMILRTALVLYLRSVVFPLETCWALRSTCGVRCPKFWVYDVVRKQRRRVSIVVWQYHLLEDTIDVLYEEMIGPFERYPPA